MGGSLAGAYISEVALGHAGGRSRQYVEVIVEWADPSELTVVVVDGSQSDAGVVLAVYPVSVMNGVVLHSQPATIFWTGYRDSQLPDSNLTVFLVRGDVPNVSDDLETR